MENRKVDPRIEHLSLDNSEVTETLCDFLSSETGNAGYNGVVVGLSGGIDSSTAAFLAVEALGPENVIGVLMPYRTSRPESREDALILAAALGIRHIEVEITPMVDPYLSLHPEMDKIRRGNVMARERMIVLYDQSCAHDCLVMGTGNKTEYLLGYTTLWGDMACGINPIGDLYKTQVRSLARHLGVPRAIIEKPPSADLWTGQTDEGELGFTYEEIDGLLLRLVDWRMSPDTLEEEGYEGALIRRVIGMIRNSRHKRTMPLSARLSNATVDLDCNYPDGWDI